MKCTQEINTLTARLSDAEVALSDIKAIVDETPNGSRCDVLNDIAAITDERDERIKNLLVINNNAMLLIDELRADIKEHNKTINTIRAQYYLDQKELERMDGIEKELKTEIVALKEDAKMVSTIMYIIKNCHIGQEGGRMCHVTRSKIHAAVDDFIETEG